MVQSYLPGGANIPSHEGTLAPPGEYDWTCASFGPPKSTTQTANRSLQKFLHRCLQSVPILHNGRPFPPKVPLPIGGSGTHLIHGFLCPHTSSIQTASRLIQPFLQASLVWQTDRQTDHAIQSVTIGHIDMRSTPMQPKKWKGKWCADCWTINCC